MDPSPSPGPDRAAALGWSIGVVVGLAGFSAIRSLLVPSGADFWVNTGAGIVLLAIGLGCGLGWSGLGLARADWGRGLRFGFAGWIIVAATLSVAALTPIARPAFADQRSEVSPLALILTVIVVIPIGTAVLEELAFRGVLLGLFEQRTSVWRAAWMSSVLFGLWHIAPTLGTASANDVLDEATRSPVLAVGLIVAMVTAMTLAGMCLCWLRIRSQSLLAPLILHAGVNSTAFLLAWLVSRS